MRTRLLIATVLVALVAVGCIPGNGDTPGLPGGGDIPTSPFGPGGFSGDAEDCLNLVFAWSSAASIGLSGTGTFEEGAEAVEDLAAAVPDEIAGDFLIYAQAMRAYGQALADAGIVLSDPSTYSTPETQQIVTDASDAFNSPNIQAAGNRISDYIEAECSDVGG